MAIPLAFDPVLIESPETGHTHVLVDGTILSNFPVWLFDRAEDQVPEWPTFGALVVEPNPMTPISERLPSPPPVSQRRCSMRTRDIVLASAFNTLVEAHDRIYLEQKQFARTIAIPSLGVAATEFDLVPERRHALYDAGRAAAAQFLESWKFSSYIDSFRRGKKYSRRREITDAAATVGYSIAGGSPESDRYVDLVLEGAGVKGVGLAGAAAVLEEAGYQPQSVAGASGGAFTAALIAGGYSAAEIKDISLGLDYRRFEDRSLEDQPLLSGVLFDRGSGSSCPAHGRCERG